MPKGVYARRPLEDRFWEKVTAVEGSDCLIWTGATYNTGYGKVSIEKGVMELTHVVAHRLTYGEPENCVLHNCDVRLCVNPSHIYDGTRGDNLQDAWDRQRRTAWDMRGSNNPFSRLSNDDVLDIRERRDLGEKESTIAKAYKVSRTTIGAILRRETWKHI